jgi:hypothetical protein
MSSNIYDNDCSIIKQPVSTDEFRKEIDLLKKEIVSLKKEVETSKSKNLINFDVVDKAISLKYRDIIRNFNDIIASSKFKDNGRDIITFSIREGIYNFIIETESYAFLKRRNLYIALSMNTEPILLKYDNNLPVHLIESTMDEQTLINQPRKACKSAHA